MGRNRQVRQRQGVLPVAAEVLEVRSMLSAGAAAAHAVAHRAAEHVRTIEPHKFNGPLNVQIQVGVGTPEVFPGTFSLSNVKLAVGAKVTAHVLVTETSNGITSSFKGTFQGSISKITTNVGNNFITVTPTGGSIVYTQREPGTKTFIAKAFPTATPMQLVLVSSTGEFATLKVTELFPSTAPGLFANQTITMNI
jgi:hypothetical protein